MTSVDKEVLQLRKKELSDPVDAFEDHASLRQVRLRSLGLLATSGRRRRRTCSGASDVRRLAERTGTEFAITEAYNRRDSL